MEVNKTEIISRSILQLEKQLIKDGIELNNAEKEAINNNLLNKISTDELIEIILKNN